MAHNADFIQDCQYYTNRYFLSSCMGWNDCIILRSDGSKASYWKKAQNSQIRIDPKSWSLELKTETGAAKDKDTKWEQSQILNVSLEETKDSDNKILYVQISFPKNEVLAVSSHRDFVNLFFLGILFFTKKDQEKQNEIVHHPLYQSKLEEFDLTIDKLKTFLNETTNEPIPPVPEPPSNMDFAIPLPTAST